MTHPLRGIAENVYWHGKTRWNALRGKPTEFKYAGNTYYINSERSTPYAITSSMPKLANLVEQISAAPEVVFDVGANCGMFSALVARRFPASRIVCFEPSRELIPIIWRNVSPVEVYSCAIGERDGETRVLFINNQSQQTNSFSKQAVDIVAKRGSIEERQVSCRTLDSVARELSIDRIDVLKVDVQGWEGHVFRGAKKLLPTVRYMFVESTWMDISSIAQLVPFAMYYGFAYATVLNPVLFGADILFTRERVDAGSHLQFELTLKTLADRWF